MQFPPILIVTPNFNKAHYLEDTIRSVLSQDYPNLHYAIIDGGSTDGSVDIIRKYAAQLAYWVSEPDGGLYDAVQKGFVALFNKLESREIGGGKEAVCMWLNSDDMLHPRSLFTVAEIFSAYPQVEWLTGAQATYDNRGRTVAVQQSRCFTRTDFLAGDYHWLQQESTCWRKSLFERAGGVRTDLRLAGDFDLWLRFFRTARLYVTDALIGGFRAADTGQLSGDITAYYAEAAQIIQAEPHTSEDNAALRRRRRKQHIAGLCARLPILKHMAIHNRLFARERADARGRRVAFDRAAQRFVLAEQAR